MCSATKMFYSYRILWLSGVLLAQLLLVTIKAQEPASPVFQNHKTKEWTNLDNITFSFDCKRRSVGFYADMEYNCQIFHMCDEEGNRIPHLCANETSFNQEYRICDWDYNFNCTESPVSRPNTLYLLADPDYNVILLQKWFYLNELTYATDPPDEDDEDY
ncbi:ckd [Drosophila busckii]|uniref:Ckd n=1 Tax=Drosophila busckii TaxID=30019 RepID=A0A0M3QVV8_DROBS|nr:ckd [Drosophila busckii]